MKKQMAFVLVLSLLLSLTGCGNPTAAAEPAAETVVFTDDCGREVELPADISRIVATGPLSQIVLHTIAPDMLVGLAAKWSASAQGIVPEEYRDLPYFGQPFRNLEEAHRFFRLYSKDQNKDVLTETFIRSQLVETGRKDFPYYMPHEKHMGFLHFSAKDIPGTIA